MATYTASVSRSLYPGLSCCQQAVMDALESMPSMGLIASLVLWSGGCAVGFAAAWLIFR